MKLSRFKKKHIFCIEGNWTHDLKDKASIRTALDFLEHNAEIKSIRKDCSAIEQFDDLIETSLQKRYKQHSIIYLAFHGSPGSLHIGKRKKMDFDTIARLLDGRAEDKIIHFGSCSTLDIPVRQLKRFWKDTGALAVSGYTKDVDFIESSVLDILYFRKCQEYRKMPIIERDMKQYYGKLMRELGFKMIYEN
jgi:hypothetical protein